MDSLTKCKIVHIIGGLVAGGAEKFVVDLLISMKNDGADVILFVLSSRTDKAGDLFADKLKASGVKCYSGPTIKVGIKSLLWLGSKLNAVKPDFIHLHTPNTELAYYLVGRFYIRNHKLFRTIHNTSIKYGAITQRAFNNNKVIKTIACGNATFEAYKDKITDNFEIIQNGVNFDWPIKSDVVINQSKLELGLDAKKKHYLCVGSMSGSCVEDSQKAQDIVIQSWQKADMQENDSVLHFLGSGNLFDEFKKMSNGDDSIKFHGIRSDVKTWLLACDFFVMPSRYEGLPIAGIESIATGIFCIYSDIKPLHELNPPYVLWVDKGSIRSLTDSFSMSRNEFNSIDTEKINEFRAMFSIDTTAQLYLNLYS